MSGKFKAHPKIEQARDRDMEAMFATATKLLPAAKSGDLIRELASRGYTTFPTIRFVASNGKRFDWHIRKAGL